VGDQQQVLPCTQPWSFWRSRSSLLLSMALVGSSSSRIGGSSSNARQQHGLALATGEQLAALAHGRSNLAGAAGPVR
jgi:hypothetical protein